MNQEQLKAILAKIDEIVRLYNEEQEQVKEPIIGQKEMDKIIEQAVKIEYVRGYKEGDKEGYTRGYDVGYQEGVNEGHQKGLKQGLDVGEEMAKKARGEGYNEGYQNCKDLKFIERYEEGIREGKRLFKEEIANNLKEFFNNNK